MNPKRLWLPWCVAAWAAGVGTGQVHADRPSREERAAESAAINEEFQRLIVGTWRWTAYKTTFFGDRSEKAVSKDGWTPQGEVTFTEDLTYRFVVLDPPKPKRALDADGTYTLSGGAVWRFGKVKGQKAVALVLSASTPKKRLTKPYGGQSLGLLGDLIKHQMQKNDTVEAPHSVTELGPDRLQILLGPSTDWLDEKASYLVLERVSSPAPSAQPGGGGELAISIGMTVEQVLALAGEPEARGQVEDKTVLRYPQVLVTVVDGRVSDVARRE